MSFELPTQIDPAAMATLAEHLKGKRLERLQASVACIDESLAAGGWLPKACQGSTKGFGQGFPVARGRAVDGGPLYDADFALRYGSGRSTWEAMVAAGATEAGLQELSPKMPVEAIVAWITVCHEAGVARTLLTAMRPLPKVTEIGLSPRVQVTLQEMGLNIDVATIEPTKIGCTWHPGYYPHEHVVERYNSETRRYHKHVEEHPQGGEPMINKRTGEPIMVPHYFLDWTEGTKMGLSRFAHKDCEACGKTIPSGEFVAIEADCATNGHVGMYFGRDCAANIFGVKDAGMPKDAK